MNNSFAQYNTIYKSHSPIIYSIALEFSQNHELASEILTSTFLKFHQHGYMQKLNTSHSVTLIKLVVQTSHETIHPNTLKKDLIIKRLKNTPILHKILCEQKSLENYCEENQITRREAAKKLRKEVKSLENIVT